MYTYSQLQKKIMCNPTQGVNGAPNVPKLYASGESQNVLKVEA